MAKRSKKTPRQQIKPFRLPCRFTVFFDGCCEPKNPGGTAGYGCIIYDGRIRVYEYSGIVPAAPDTSNNVAEYLAFNTALDWFIGGGRCGDSIQMFGDSKLVIEQMFGTWKIHGVDTRDRPKGRYADTAARGRELLKKFNNISGFWIPREENSEADDASKGQLRKAGVEFRIQPE
jgi:ribonuclease HI